MIHGEGEVMVPAHLNFGKFVLDRLRKVNPDHTCLKINFVVREAYIQVGPIKLRSQFIRATPHPTLTASPRAYYCSSGDKLSYGEFTQHAVSVGAALSALGVARGDTVAVAGEPHATLVPTTLAVMLTGAIYTYIEFDCGRAVLIHKLNLTRPKYVICSRLFWEAFQDILTGLDFIKTLICFDNISDLLSVATMSSRRVDVTTFEPAVVRGETDVAMILYSSGTTGISKGVLLTHLNCLAKNSSKLSHDLLSQKICMLPNTMSGAITFYTYYFLTAGKTILYSNKIDRKTLQDYQVDTLCVIPASVAELAEAENEEGFDLSSLKFIYTGSGPLHPTVAKSIIKRYPDIKLTQTYGTTEAGFIASREFSHGGSAVGSSAFRGVVLKVVDVETRAILDPNQRGEIWVRTPCLMKGYLGTTAYLNGQGFYPTGDLGYYDDHKYVYIVDRLKDVISYKGKKTAPGEIEAVLLGHPAVLEAAVVGKPAGAVGELPTAFVVLRPGAQATENELIDYVAKEVSWFMRLAGGVRFLSELPKNLGLKVERRRLKKMLELEEPRGNSRTSNRDVD